MRPNRLRRLLAQGRPTLGTSLHSAWPGMVEAVGHTGVFDYVEFQAEYAPFDLDGLENFCRAAEVHGLGSMIKIDFEPKRFLAQRGIGAGFESVLFTDCRTAEDVRACVRAVRPDTPEDGGEYGAVNRRFTYMQGGTPEYVRALREIVIAIMIEKREAVENLSSILEVPGIDMIQWGAGDYAMSMGRPGELDSPWAHAEEERAIRMAQAKGVEVRGWLPTMEQAERYLARGVRHFSLGTDIRIVHAWLEREGTSLRAMMGRAT